MSADRAVRELSPGELAEQLLVERVAEVICPADPESMPHQIIDHGACRMRARRAIEVVRGEA